MTTENQNAKTETANSELNISPGSLIDGLIALGDNEDSKGNFRVILDYDNYQDGARVLDGDGNVLGECYDGPEADPAKCDPEYVVNWQFKRAIEAAILSANDEPTRREPVAHNQSKH